MGCFGMDENQGELPEQRGAPSPPPCAHLPVQRGEAEERVPQVRVSGVELLIQSMEPVLKNNDERCERCMSDVRQL